MTDPRIKFLKTPAECEEFAKNVEQRGFPDLAKEARRAGVVLRAAASGATTAVEIEAVQCVCAFEDARAKQTGKASHANRTRRSFKENGIIATVENIVSRSKVTTGYDVLREYGLEEFTFEAVVLRHPTVFSAKAVENAATRLV